LILAIEERLPASAKVRRVGETGIEVTVVKKEPAELDSLKRRITTNGPVSFHRFVIGTDPNARRVIDAAVDLPKTDSEVKLKGQTVSKWFSVYSTDFDPTFLFDSNIVSRINNSHTELLVWNNPERLTGDYLLSAKKAFDEKGILGIEFEFNKSGAKRLRSLTRDDAEREVSKQVLGLFIDDRAFSGTVLEKQIDSMLFIGNLPEYEIDSILSILNAGALPYPLKEIK
jgi:preprotein translocase subunit SecD